MEPKAQFSNIKTTTGGKIESFGQNGGLFLKTFKKSFKHVFWKEYSVCWNLKKIDSVNFALSSDSYENNMNSDRYLFNNFWALGTSKRILPLKTQHRFFNNFRIQQHQTTPIEHFQSEVGIRIINGLPEDLKSEKTYNVSRLG